MSNYLRLIRPAQWFKNVFVFAGVVFAGRLDDPQALSRAALAFALFCVLSSAVYVINDVVDRESDREHPRKRNRPLAAGTASVNRALILVALLLGIALIGGTLLWQAGLVTSACVTTAWIYFVLTVLYTFWLKQLAILDVVAISLGFVLRAVGGALAVPVVVSPWLLVCTFTLCLFLGFGKRRAEIAMLGRDEQAQRHRATLADYSPEVLTHMLSISAGIAVVTFLLYTMDRSVAPTAFRKELLIFTLPLVIYGIFRYAMLIETGTRTGPTDILINDRPFLAAVVLWGLATVAIVYAGDKWNPLLEVLGMLPGEGGG